MEEIQEFEFVNQNSSQTNNQQLEINENDNFIMKNEKLK